MALIEEEKIDNILHNEGIVYRFFNLFSKAKKI